MAVDGEAFGDVGLGEGFLHVADAVGEAAALVGGEGNAIQEKKRIFAVDKSTEYHEVINEETAVFASMVVQHHLNR